MPRSRRCQIKPVLHKSAIRAWAQNEPGLMSLLVGVRYSEYPGGWSGGFPDCSNPGEA